MEQVEIVNAPVYQLQFVVQLRKAGTCVGIKIPQGVIEVEEYMLVSHGRI